MDTELEFQEKPDHLLAQVRGRFDATALRARVVEISERAKQGGFRRVLVDANGVAAPINSIKEYDRYWIGLAVAEFFPAPFRVAVLWKAEMITKFSENVAVNRGAMFLVCADEAKALQWLLE